MQQKYYDKNGNVLSEATGSGRTVTYLYNKANLLTDKTSKRGSQTLETYALTYYADGNVKSVTANGVMTQPVLDEINTSTATYPKKHTTYKGECSMRKLLAMTITAALLLTAVLGTAPGFITTAGATEYNLLANPGFETGDFLPWTYGQPEFSITSVQRHSGEYAVKLVGTASWSYLGQTVNVVPHTNYVWTVWMKSSGASGARLKVLRTAADGGGLLPGTTFVDNTGGNEWTQYTVNFNSGGYSQLILSVSDSQKNRTHYIDDFDLRAAASPTAVPTSHDAALSALTYQPAGCMITAVPGFSATDAGGTYAIALTEGITSVTVGATKADETAAMQITPAGGVVDVSGGSGTATVVVTAEDGITSNTYTVIFNVSSNVIANPGFETGAFSPWVYGEPQFSITSAQSHSGTYSVRLVGNASWSYVGQVVTVVPNTNYTWTVWIKSSAIKGAQLRVLRLPADGGGILAGTSAVNNTGGNEWTQYTIDFNSGSYSQLNITVSDSYPGRTHYIDDFDVRVAGAATPMPLSDNAKLSSLVYQPGGGQAAAVPGFTAADGSKTYGVTLPEGTASVTAGATVADANAAMQITPANGIVDVSSGSGTATITVTAQNGVTVNTYVVNFTVPTNLLANAGFETGDFTSWTASDTFSITTEQVHSGTYAVKLADYYARWTSLSQAVAVMPQTDYTWRVYGRSSYFSAGFYVYTAGGEQIRNCGRTKWSPNAWERYTFTFNSGDNSAIWLVIRDTRGGVHYFDDFDLR